MSQRFLLVNIYMENPSLTVADLSALAGLIDLACTRGAFRANEAKDVGELYDKLTGFLQVITSQAQSDDSGESQPQGE